MLPEVKFVTNTSSLSRIPQDADYVSALFADMIATPTGWDDVKGKRYLSVAQAEQDGITKNSAQFGVLHYHISEFFRLAPEAELYVMDDSQTGFGTQSVFDMTQGRVRQVYWKKNTDFTGLSAAVAEAQSMADDLDQLYAPCQFFVNIKDETVNINGTSQPDMRSINSPNVSVLIAGSDTGQADALADSLGINYIDGGGAVLALTARANVHESIAWVARNDLAFGSEYEKIRFCDGSSYASKSLATLDSLNTKGFLFIKKHTGLAGAYMNDTHTAVTLSNDLSNIENNRTLHKAKRGIRTVLLPDLNAPLRVDNEGKIAIDVVKYFENKTSRPLILMENAGEISAYRVFIDPNQNVLATSKLIIQVRLSKKMFLFLKIQFITVD